MGYMLHISDMVHMAHARSHVWHVSEVYVVVLENWSGFVDSPPPPHPHPTPIRLAYSWRGLPEGRREGRPERWAPRPVQPHPEWWWWGVLVRDGDGTLLRCCI
jgi:hypothetical protein